jgi:hypothetical protein
MIVLCVTKTHGKAPFVFFGGGFGLSMANEKHRTMNSLCVKKVHDEL